MVHGEYMYCSRSVFTSFLSGIKIFGNENLIMEQKNALEVQSNEIACIFTEKKVGNIVSVLMKDLFFAVFKTIICMNAVCTLVLVSSFL